MCFGHWVNCDGDHIQSSFPCSVLRIWKSLIFVENDANVLSLGMFQGIAVVANVAGFYSEYTVVSSEFAVLAGEPGCATLAENYIARDDEFACN